MMEPIRCHFSMVFEKAITSLRQLVPTILLLIFSFRSFRIGWIIGGIAVLLLLTAVYLILLWLKTTVFTSDDQLIVSSGVFWKKQTAIPFEKINTVDISRNVLQRILGTCRLKVDTGAVKTEKSSSELDLIFALEQARILRKHILQLAETARQPDEESSPSDYPENNFEAYTKRTWQHEDSEQTAQTGSNAAAFFGVDELEADTDFVSSDDKEDKSSYQASIRSLIIYALTKSKIGAGLLAIVSAFALFDELITDELITTAEENIRKAASSIIGQKLLIIVLGTIFLILAIYIVANVISILLTIIKYFHFRARRSTDHIYIRYGLLTEKSFSMPVHNIHAIIIKQSFIRKRLGKASVEVQSIGYGDDNKETALLLPLVEFNDIEELLQQLLPEYARGTFLNKPPRRALRRFLLIPALIVLLAEIPAFIFYKPALLSLVFLLPLVLITRWFSYKNAAIGYNEDFVEIRNGSWHSSLYRIKTEAVQTIGTRAHPFLRRSGIAHYELNYHAPVLSSSVWASFLEDNHLKKLRRLLETCD